MKTPTPTYDVKDLVIPGDRTTVYYGQRTLNLFGKIKYTGKVIRAYRTLNKFNRDSLRTKVCYYGPFKGEFGHFLLHNLPYLTFLYKNGVEIHYCGMQLHEPFLQDENGKSMIAKWYPLRDFFSEVKPRANEATAPPDVETEIESFRKLALASGKPFLDLSDNDRYWFVFRNWQLNGRQASFDYCKVYNVKRENAVTLFPRKKGGDYTLNNGGNWDYQELAEALSPYFDTVYITGHPSMSAEIKETGNIRLRLSANNRDVIECCAASRLIISQHSGAVHMGAYTKSDVLVIFNGKPPVKGLQDTLRFRENIAGNGQLNFAFSLEEIVGFVKNHAG